MNAFKVHYNMHTSKKSEAFINDMCVARLPKQKLLSRMQKEKNAEQVLRQLFLTRAAIIQMFPFETVLCQIAGMKKRCRVKHEQADEQAPTEKQSSEQKSFDINGLKFNIQDVRNR